MGDVGTVVVGAMGSVVVVAGAVGSVVVRGCVAVVVFQQWWSKER